jgi:dipeptidyl aminopeptidase/acylaminoacyl peptidase
MSAFDLDAFLAMPRLTGLAAGPGERLVAATATAAGTRFVGALWALDPAGRAAPRRLTVADASSPVAAPDGAVLFLRKDDGDEAAGLWRLPPSGDAHPLARPGGGVEGVRVAARAGRVVAAVRLFASSSTLEADAERAAARREAGVTAHLAHGFPLRFWDHWLGPREQRLLVTEAPAALDDEPAWRDLAPDAAGALEQPAFDVTPDGSTVVTTWWRPVHADGASQRAAEPFVTDPRERVADLVAIDVASGARRLLHAADRASHTSVACSPDGTQVVAGLAPLGSPDEPPHRTLILIDVASGVVRDLLPRFDRWPEDPVWLAAGEAVLFTADDDGYHLPYRVDVASGAVCRLADEGAYTALTPAWDGSAVWALRSSIGRQPLPVRLAAENPETGRDDSPAAADPEHPSTRLPAPGDDLHPPGRVERVSATADDGARVPGWLVLPATADGPAPLAVLIHGGPLSSWNTWHWRWNPHLFAARGWAVLLPDPALSTGYGLDHIRRGWARWGAEPFHDVLALVDAVAARTDIDGERAAALGGSFGGYMANWIAGQTARFRAIVTHASLWNLEAFHGTTDLGPWWEQQFGDRYANPEAYRAWSPHRQVASVRTPMLVIHGERDFRVPYSEALMLVTDLARHGVHVSYLHFPDEHHWISKPQHVRLWYETVFAFCEHHVLGRPWQSPALLG